MSSHHFVREGQEPALFIFEPIHYSEAEGLLEWAPLVMVAATALDEVLSWGIKIDVVLARQEQVETLTAELTDQAPVKILAASNDVVESALQFLMGIGQPAVSIIAKDFTEEIRSKIENVHQRVQVTVRTGTQKWALIQSGIFKKWYQSGSLIDFSDQNLAPRIPGLKKQQNGYELTEDQWISIDNPKPFWVGEFT